MADLLVNPNRSYLAGIDMKYVIYSSGFNLVVLELKLGRMIPISSRDI